MKNNNQTDNSENYISIATLLKRNVEPENIEEDDSNFEEEIDEAAQAVEDALRKI